MGAGEVREDVGKLGLAVGCRRSLGPCYWGMSVVVLGARHGYLLLNVVV
jgi:hypothetical protein